MHRHLAWILLFSHADIAPDDPLLSGHDFATLMHHAVIPMLVKQHHPRLGRDSNFLPSHPAVVREEYSLTAPAPVCL